MAFRLCPRCLSLRLSVAKFRIQEDPSGEASCPSASAEVAIGRYPLGTMTQIRDSAQKCDLCDLVAFTVRDAGVPHTDDVTCHLIWEIDGRVSADPAAGHGATRTRRLRICWGGSKLKLYEDYIMLRAAQKYDRSDVDYPSLLNDETQFLGRRIGSNCNKKNLIREFLRLCETGHDYRCTAKLGYEDPFRKTLTEPYFGVIDMENENLVPLPNQVDGHFVSFEPYATVSYVWGTGHSGQHATRIGNVQSRRRSGGLSAVIRSLPKALRQSIELVHGLGIRYMWIDCLCIVQDSRHCWNLNARAMHLIYGNSTLTVCAADGKDATAGLVALDEDHTPVQKDMRYAEDVCLMLHRPVETSIETTEWNKRAWTFQERLLSKRCLIFTEGRIFFQCRSTSMSEDVFADRSGRGWSLDLVRAPLQKLSQLKIRAMWFYCHCVDLYSRRQLHESFDILAAFSGMCKLMEKTMRAPFVFGLPASHLDFALLWQPVGRSERRVEPDTSDDPKYKDMRFPSWSWCGWKNNGVRYDPEMLNGRLADVQTWLLQHTWIDWHIRDGYGTLRRVWDARRNRQDRSEDPRWRGYKRPVATPRRDKGDAEPHVSSSHTESPPSTQDDESDESDASSISNRSDGSDGSSESDDVVLRYKRHPEAGRWKSQTGERRSRVNVVRAERPGPMPRNTTRSVRHAERTGFPSGVDKFGRSYLGLPKSSPSTPEFELTLPEDPYHVHTTERSKDRRRASQDEELPDQPFLQFFTWKAHFHVRRPDAQGNAATKPDALLCRCDITDRRGDKCGSVAIDVQLLDVQNSDTRFEFIAISDAKMFTDEEFPQWTYYIPRERIESEWDAYFVLLVQFYPDEGIYRRLALGKVFRAAFTNSQEEWTEIILG
ncbi:hypothetical protein VTK73DRAFT_8470 [Phialemonium thermophilum]|uniref:Heterokaryon incompatibility domain-containing protein n=1 Tax=Phialemonium thermophilum TaxID=223376 RepID=A0ABR3W8G1_9PEZI